LTEIWFYGGVEKDLKPELVAVVRRRQPNALLFNCLKVGGLLSSGDPQRNSGSGCSGNDCYNVSGPVWSTYCCADPGRRHHARERIAEVQTRDTCT